MLTEQLAQIVSRATEREIAHVQVLAHRRPFAGRNGPLKLVASAANTTGKIKVNSATANRGIRLGGIDFPTGLPTSPEVTDMTEAEVRHRLAELGHRPRETLSREQAERLVGEATLVFLFR